MARRRYRLSILCAVVIVFLLYRVVQNSGDEPAGYGNLRTPPKPHVAHPLDDGLIDVVNAPVPAPPPKPLIPAEEQPVGDKPSAPLAKGQQSDGRVEKDKNVGVDIPVLKDHDKEDGRQDSKAESPRPATAAKDAAGADEDEPSQITDKPTLHKKPSEEDKEDVPAIHAQRPPNGEQPHRINTATRVHWTQVPEHFPVPEESLLTLPTGTPKKIPRIQYEFGVESPDSKVTRLQRQLKVKTELERAWAGYRKFAWMHDELSPLSGSYRDPFCGWAATLVDTLDTLWIAGMTEEFDEAAKAVKQIDFTWSPRQDIPVFETTIRYLGGLLAAYDVSGGHKGQYAILLEKATELAEILMGIFDTPNRMPLLFYRWSPEYASQPHRADTVGIAELGTLSMEFTRLAQLTGKQKYYDAIDRITNALIEMQEAGRTAIPGLFPETLNASGCNRTATTLRNSLSKAAQEQMDSEELPKEPVGYTSAQEVEKKHARVPEKGTIYTDEVYEKRKGKPDAPDDRLERRDVPAQKPGVGGHVQHTVDIPIPPMGRRPPYGADGSTADWDCVPQGLVSNSYAYDTYHVGGAQDSAYEYFPKQYLLLGGLEPKYQKLHVDTIEAVNEWLLYRPMIKEDGWDILFPAKVGTSGHPETDLSPMYEVTHLTCFVGGMYGLGAKIFGREQDLETAKKLTDGCVWAYQATTSGIMPEFSHVLPCPSLEKCDFNETLWWEYLDPSKDWRQSELKKWEAAEEERKMAKDQAETERLARLRELEDTTNEDVDAADKTDAGSDRFGKRASIPPQAQEKKPSDRGNAADSELPESLKEKLDPKHGDGKQKHEVVTTETSDSSTANGKTSGRTKDKGTSRSTANTRDPDFRQKKPMTHEEFVKEKLTNERLPPGFVDVRSRSYILRPEAIESVWYMYRITGDPTWMEKGWRMFEATVIATRTEFANSAIDDVLAESPLIKDEMESFWLAETLKYYYLLFSEPSLISLDEWVLNTEAHPFRRPDAPA